MDKDEPKKEPNKIEQDPQKKEIEQDPQKKEIERDQQQELRETEQEVMFELKLKTDEFLEKFKAHNKKNRVSM